MLDIVVGGRYGNIEHYRATDVSDTYPTLTDAGYIQASGSNIDVGYNSAPVVVDWDEDGLHDLLVGSQGNYYGGDASVFLYLNEGSTGNPQFGDYTEISCGGTVIDSYRVVPDVADLSLDGKKDLILGEYQGYVEYYENTGTNEDPQFSDMEQLTYDYGSSYIDHSNTRATIHDWNEDGLLDLVCGCYSGNMIVYLGYEVRVGEETSAPAGRIAGISVQSPSYGTAPVKLNLNGSSNVDLQVYDTSGRLVENRALGRLETGGHSIPLDLSGEPAGMYVVVCTTESARMTDRTVLLR
ncbi:T9SS type A sorting domain-containing protein [Candidatus Fermentibacteria bacterium]|nr:T9SS type A sorting domain-containing protein [Candidatus Fermentibacteria bacterium]